MSYSLVDTSEKYERRQSNTLISSRGPIVVVQLRVLSGSPVGIGNTAATPIIEVHIGSNNKSQIIYMLLILSVVFECLVCQLASGVIPSSLFHYSC